MTEQFIYQDGRLRSGQAYSLVGRPVHGSAEHISPDITKIGQDAAVILPDHNVLGVFDGAGGAAEIGSPEVAALTAAEATRHYFARGGDSLSDAMAFARTAVRRNTAAGVCVGALIRLHQHHVESVTAGDAGALLYDVDTQEVTAVAEQQLHNAEPANYLGRTVPYAPVRTADHYAAVERAAQELYLMSDGALGNRELSTDVQDYHLDAAHHSYQLLRDAIAFDPEFTAHIRHTLTDPSAEQLTTRQMDETATIDHPGDVMSQELLHPETFHQQQFDWDIWEDIVKPYIDRLDPPRSAIGRRAICEALIKRPIAWPFERPHRDDATVVMVEDV